MDEIWPQLRAYLLETGQCVEMEGGELLTYEHYQALYERAQQVAQEQKLAEAPVSFAASTLECWHQQFVETQQTTGEGEQELGRQAAEYHEPMTDEGAWSLLQAQEQALVVRGKLASNRYAILVAVEQGDRGCILIYSRVEQRVIAQLSCDEECEQVVESLCEQGDEHEVTEEAMACHGNQMMQEKPDGGVAC